MFKALMRRLRRRGVPSVTQQMILDKMIELQAEADELRDMLATESELRREAEKRLAVIEELWNKVKDEEH